MSKPRRCAMPDAMGMDAWRGTDSTRVPSPAASKSTPSMVTVMGFDSNDVLFRSDKVGAVQWRDSKGRIVAILVRLKPDIWGFSKNGDSDWDEVLRIYGNNDVT